MILGELHIDWTLMPTYNTVMTIAVGAGFCSIVNVAKSAADEEKQTLTHSVFTSLFPNWIGQTQPRVVKIEGDLLYLGTASPIVSGVKK
jgi:hypothetical protein